MHLKEKVLRTNLNDFTSKNFEIFVTTIYTLSDNSQKKTWLTVIRFLLLKVSEKDKSNNAELKTKLEDVVNFVRIHAFKISDRFDEETQLKTILECDRIPLQAFFRNILESLSFMLKLQKEDIKIWD